MVIASSCCFNGHLGISILAYISLAHVVCTLTHCVIIVLLILVWNHSISLQDCNVSYLLNRLPIFSVYGHSFARYELRCLHTVLSYASLSLHTRCS